MNRNHLKWRRQRSSKPVLSYRQLIEWASERGLYKFGMTKKQLEALYRA